MKQILDLDTFAKTLTDKGYDGYFLTQADYPDKIKSSIKRFLEACRNGTDKPLYPDLLPLQTYLEWNGEDRSKVSCHIWVAHENGKFDVRKMEIERTDRYGQSLKKSELTNLTTGSLPTVKEAIALVTEKPKEWIPPKKGGFRM